MIKLFTIIKNTFIESIRQPIYLVLLGCSLGLILLSPYFTLFALLHNNKMVKDMGLATILLSGLFLSIFSASSVIYQEVENKTILTILSKPINRGIFIVGKYLGILASIFIAQYILSIVLLDVVRTDITEAAYSPTDYPVLFGYLFAIVFSLILAAFANFFYEKPFTSSAILISLPVFTFIFLLLGLVNHDWKLQPVFHKLNYEILIASLLIFLGTSLLTAVITSLSIRLPAASTFILGILIFLLSLFSDYMFGRHMKESIIAKIIYYIIPNLQVYWVTDAIIENKSIPLDYLYFVIIYTVLFIITFVSISIILFHKKEA